MKLNPILLGSLATSAWGAVIATDKPGFVGQEIEVKTPDVSPAPKFQKTRRQLQRPVEGQWIWGADGDQCDGSNEYKTMDDGAEITDCQWIQKYMSNHPGYYQAFDWKTNEQYPVAIYRTCTIALILNDQNRDVVSIGSQNIADILSYVLDPKHHLSLDGEAIAVKGKGTCSAEPTTAQISWIIHATNGTPYDSSVVIIPPPESELEGKAITGVSSKIR